MEGKKSTFRVEVNLWKLDQLVTVFGTGTAVGMDELLGENVTMSRARLASIVHLESLLIFQYPTLGFVVPEKTGLMRVLGASRVQ